MGFKIFFYKFGDREREREGGGEGKRERGNQVGKNKIWRCEREMDDRKYFFINLEMDFKSVVSPLLNGHI